MNKTIEQILVEISVKYNNTSEIKQNWQSIVIKLSQPELLEYLSSKIISNYHIETLITHIRRIYFFNVTEKTHNDDLAVHVPLLSAISLACFNHEYVFYLDEIEQDEFDAYIEHTETNMENISLFDILIISCYQCLSGNETISNHIKTHCSLYTPIEQVIKRQLYDISRQHQNKQHILRLNGNTSKTTALVKSHYENNPYPRWTKYDNPIPIGLSEFIQSKIHNLNDIVVDIGDSFSILIAGCGTGLSSIEHAIRFPKAKITAIDLSLNSLAYAKTMAEEQGITQIKFIQADISQLYQLDKRFDYIECLGVLSHVEKPKAACEMLIEYLNSGGMFRFSLYSENSRKHIVQLAKKISAMGYTENIINIRKLRHSIINNEMDMVCKDPLTVADFYSLTGFRDLFFHSYERNYGIEDVYQLVTDLNLCFLGMELACDLPVSTEQSINDSRSLEMYKTIEQQLPKAFYPSYIAWSQK